MPDASDNFLTVARYLIADTAPDGEDPAWQACENARARAAASRAYYAVFIALKLRVMPYLRRSKRNFPANDAHRRVLLALRKAGHHSTAAKLEELRREREHADYEWDEAWTAQRAEDSVRKGRAAMATVESLKDGGMQALAKSLGI